MGIALSDCTNGINILYGLFRAKCGPAFLRNLSHHGRFFSATQDIIIDAYRIEVLAPHEYAAGSAMTVLGWHIGGTIVGGAGGSISWPFSTGAQPIWSWPALSGRHYHHFSRPRTRRVWN